MKRPIIAITPKTGKDQREESPYCYVFPKFIQMISECGGIPITLCNQEGSFQVSDMHSILERVDGVLFTGGPDLHPGLYGEDVMDCCGEIAEERDALEILLMQEAIRMNKPVLAVCRGFQIMNVALGGSLYQDIGKQHKSSVQINHSQEEKDAVHPAHKVNVIRDTPLHQFSKGLLQIGVNSLHHQAINKLAEPLRSMAAADDGIIEAVYHPEKDFVIGVQWHPEILGISDSVSEELFLAFVDACAKQE